MAEIYIIMYTLIYMDGHFNRPETLESYILSNAGGDSALLRIDCLTPFKGSEQDFIHDVCHYLSSVNPHYEVSYDTTQNVRTEESDGQLFVHFLVIQVLISER